MARTTKTRTKPSPSEDLHKEVQNLKVETASLRAEKVSWRWWVTAHAASIVFMLSVMGAGFLFLDTKIEAVKVEVAELSTEVAVVKANQANMQEDINDLQEDINDLADGVRMLLELGIAQQSGDPAAIDAAQSDIDNYLDETASEIPSDTTSDASTKTPITGIELGEGLVVAPSDSLGETRIYTANTPTLTPIPQEI